MVTSQKFTCGSDGQTRLRFSDIDVELARAPRRGHGLCRHVVNTRCIVLLWLRPCRVSPVG